ncbi:hypothetical protein BaRGS_00026256, partial [Batillaria attramentaria]
VCIVSRSDGPETYSMRVYGQTNLKTVLNQCLTPPDPFPQGTRKDLLRVTAAGRHVYDGNRATTPACLAERLYEADLSEDVDDALASVTASDAETQTEEVTSEEDRNQDEPDKEGLFQIVFAVMDKDITLLPGAMEYLCTVLPQQLKVQVHQSGTKLIVSGTLMQISQVAVLLAKFKQEQCCPVKSLSQPHAPHEEREMEGDRSFSQDAVSSAVTKDGAVVPCGVSGQVVYVDGSEVNMVSSTSPQAAEDAAAGDSAFSTLRNAKHTDLNNTVAHRQNFTHSNLADAPETHDADLPTSELHSLLVPSCSPSLPANSALTDSTGNNGRCTVAQEVELGTILIQDAAVRSKHADSRRNFTKTLMTNSQLSVSNLTPLGLSTPISTGLCCGVCSAVCDEDGVSDHMRRWHAAPGDPVRCQVCSLAFPEKRLLFAHLRSEHEAAGFTCQLCGKQFKQQRYLRIHLQRHAGVKNFECSVCGWRFMEKEKLKWHMESHKDETERQLRYQCKLCSRQFYNKAGWMDHLNTHTGNRPFQCPICEASFRHRVGLGRHMLTHDKNKAHVCPHCPKAFSLKSKLNEHIILHTGVSKHRCHHCQRVFTAAASLKRHLTRCTVSAKPHVGQESGADIPAPDSPPSDNSEPVFLCGTCGQAFSSLNVAEQHALSNHSNANDASSDLQDVEVASSHKRALPSGQLTTLQQESGCRLIKRTVEGRGGADSNSSAAVEAGDSQFIVVGDSGILSQALSTAVLGYSENEASSVKETRAWEVVAAGEKVGAMMQDVQRDRRVSYEEQQIHLAASTLADLSSFGHDLE